MEKREDGGWTESAQNWIDHIELGDTLREDILDEPFLNCIKSRSPQNLLDLGCGEGRLIRMIAELGIHGTGLDPTEDLLRAARIRDPEGSYVNGFAEKLPFEDDSFEMVTSVITIPDIEDIDLAVSEVVRVLKPGGHFLAATLSPFVTCVPFPWKRDEQGNALYRSMDWYGWEHATKLEWRGISIVNFHRSMSRLMRPFLEQGLVLTQYEEPLPSLEKRREKPGLWEDVRVPLGMIMEWRKP